MHLTNQIGSEMSKFWVCCSAQDMLHDSAVPQPGDCGDCTGRFLMTGHRSESSAFYRKSWWIIIFVLLSIWLVFPGRVLMQTHTLCKWFQFVNKVLNCMNLNLSDRDNVIYFSLKAPNIATIYVSPPGYDVVISWW